jgi:hypothetical protein
MVKFVFVIRDEEISLLSNVESVVVVFEVVYVIEDDEILI